jgi:hypothetical protein
LSLIRKEGEKDERWEENGGKRDKETEKKKRWECREKNEEKRRGEIEMRWDDSEDVWRGEWKEEKRREKKSREFFRISDRIHNFSAVECFRIQIE